MSRAALERLQKAGLKGIHLQALLDNLKPLAASGEQLQAGKRNRAPAVRTRITLEITFQFHLKYPVGHNRVNMTQPAEEGSYTWCALQSLSHCCLMHRGRRRFLKGAASRLSRRE